MRGTLLLALGAAFIAAPLLAGEKPAASTPVPAAAPTPVTTPTPAPDSIALNELSRRMTVPVSVADRGPYPFIVDTGAERSVLSQELASSLGLDAGPRARLFDFTGPSMVDTVRVPSLTLGKLSMPGLDAPALARANLGAPGMLGIDALQGHKVIIDFNRKRMNLVPAKRHAEGEIVLRTGTKTGQLIVTNALFEGRPISVVIDTGSSLSVGNSAMRRLMKREPRLLGPILVRSVTGRTFAADYVTVPVVKIGGVIFHDFAMSFADVPPFEHFGLKDRPALILGMNSMRLFSKVELDFLNREIGFTLQRGPIDFLSACRDISSCSVLTGKARNP
ncbi:MAG TPA: retropepsin-like aspartic protease [Sphingomonas sp.]|nr:retropepsin-like aspartic protease [Sphingomonas sp.]